MEELGLVALEAGSPATAGEGGAGRRDGGDDEDQKIRWWLMIGSGEEEEVAEEEGEGGGCCGCGGGAAGRRRCRRRQEMKMIKLPGGEGADQIWTLDTLPLLLSSFNRPPSTMDLNVYIYTYLTLHIKSQSLANCKNGPPGFCEPRSTILDNEQIHPLAKP